MSRTQICALSGVVASEDEMDLVDAERNNPPMGWTRFTIETTLPSADYAEMDEVERAMLRLSIQALVGSGLSKPDARMLARWQTAATFSHLRSAVDPYEVVTVVVDIAPRERVPELGTVIDSICATLGVSLYDDEDDVDDVDDVEGSEDDEGDEGDEGAATPAPAHEAAAALVGEPGASPAAEQKPKPRAKR